MPDRPSLLLVTDLTYPARGRRYGDEDVRLAAQLRTDFDVALCHPLDARALMDGFDLVLVRNSGPVIHHQHEFEAFAGHARRTGARVFTQLTGRADMAGKQYLVDLGRAGHPVIPTVDDPAHLGDLPPAEEYVVKPKLGADSIGLRVVPRHELTGTAAPDRSLLVQPRIRFRYEVSFYFVDHDFQYALHAPDPHRRWDLEPYPATADDLAFAQRFIDWNTIEHGIQRVDACRTPEGDLLLVELEDLNPYLSLDRLDENTRQAFVVSLRSALHRLHARPTSPQN
ncbi:hypothetical protein KIH74_05645 [Kineosporia sp. J2-2]|uniref:ATP-grasp domain-containing protein n=1 Tax=Kineosporia corallincola TaxID=2835133 RepID=A0ABS5TBE0_9ACTN|nr:hypothetical protein [Kineosporia corallincola]MBT0768397.1 hypothetical protein [Kineosporia corallincola]